jgi:hypothetical protein
MLQKLNFVALIIKQKLNDQIGLAQLARASRQKNGKVIETASEI